MSIFDKLFGGKSEDEKMMDEVCKEIYIFLNDDDEQNKFMPPLLRDNLTRGSYSYVPGAVGEYGRNPRNPIPCNGVVGEVTYLSRLAMEYEVDGETYYQGFTFHRLGSSDCVDIFEIISFDGCLYDILYLDMYYEHKSDIAPQGYAFRESVSFIRGTSEMNPNFPYQQAEQAAAWAEGHVDLPVFDRDICEMDFEQAEKTIELIRSSNGSIAFKWW